MPKYITEVDIATADRVNYADWTAELHPGTCIYHAPADGGPALFVRYNSLKDFKFACDHSDSPGAAGIISTSEGVQFQEGSLVESAFKNCFGLYRVETRRAALKPSCVFCRNTIEDAGYTSKSKYLAAYFYSEKVRMIAHLECLVRNMEQFPVRGHPAYKGLNKYPNVIIRTLKRPALYVVWFDPYYGMMQQLFEASMYKDLGGYKVELGEATHKGFWDAFRNFFPGFPEYPFVGGK